MGERVEVVVVGAGVAGLVCAATLQRRGIETLLLEGSDRVGGRVTTDLVDGFQCDVGFQLLNPGYPAARRLLDLDALDLCAFTAGVRVRSGDTVHTLADPRRAPHLLPATVASGLLSPRELAGLARWVAPVLVGRPGRRASGGDRTLSAAWDSIGVNGPLRRQVLEPFLTGVLADRSGQSSDRFARLLVRSFLLGTPAVPRAGMQALPAQLAGRLLTPPRLGTLARSVTGGSAAHVDTDGGRIGARVVVVATDGAAATALGVAPPVRTGGLCTWWFAAPEPVGADRLLLVDGDRGPIVNTGDLSAVAPDYAPPGRTLVQGTALSEDALTEDSVRRELARLWRTGTGRWELVARHDVTRALPLTRPPLTLRRDLARADGIVVSGDHTETPSLQGALVAGRRAANQVSADLRVH